MRVANHNKIFRIFFIYCRWHCFLMKHFQNVKTCLYRTLLFMYMELRGWVVITLPLYCRGPHSNLGPLSAIQNKLSPICPQFLQANTSILLKLEYLNLTFFISLPVHCTVMILPFGALNLVRSFDCVLKQKCMGRNNT